MSGLLILKSYKDYKRVYNQKSSFSNKYFVFYVRKNNIGYSRFGYSISKKVGKAVERNRIRRILKEICRLNLDVFIEDYDYVFIVRPFAKGISYAKACEYVLLLNNKVKKSIFSIEASLNND